MYRALDLSMHQDILNEMLNNPKLRLIKMHISCSEETAFTVASVRMERCEPRKTRFKRRVERYTLSPSNTDEIDEKLSNKKYRMIKHHVFPTSEGTIVVLDYQVRRER